MSLPPFSYIFHDPCWLLGDGNVFLFKVRVLSSNRSYFLHNLIATANKSLVDVGRCSYATPHTADRKWFVDCEKKEIQQLFEFIQNVCHTTEIGIKFMNVRSVKVPTLETRKKSPITIHPHNTQEWYVKLSSIRRPFVGFFSSSPSS